jgi:7,8-dihydropterin-6-yl-methyl-4-(beta-D-ribofuranosyl)aminobenzene 5'-phosphate synthase
MTAHITILYDNRSERCDLQEGWGFSAFVEYEGAKILFDTGGDASAFSANAHKMQIPLHEVSHLLFSHRHWDHLAGFKDIVSKMSKKTELYLPKTFPWRLRKFGAFHLSQTKVVKSFHTIAPNIYSLVLRGGFCLYEQALVLKTPAGIGIITGCAHPGIVQILKAAKKELQTDISFVIGGFHLLFDPAARTADVVKKFQALGVQKVAPCHCSGDHTIRQFQLAYGPNFFKVGTGTHLTF